MSFWDWFMGEAGAGWIVGILGLLGGLYAWSKRERPNHVVIQEIETIRLLDIHETQKSKLKVFYIDSQGHQEQIQNLEQKKVVIYNNGTRDIADPIKIKLGFLGSRENEFMGFWRLVFNKNLYTYRPVLNDIGKASSVIIEMPYLNSYLSHKEHVSFYIISDGSIELKLQEGSDKGWSAYLVTLTRAKKTYRLFTGVIGIFTLFPFVITISILAFISVYTGNNPPNSEDIPSWLGYVFVFASMLATIGLPLFFLSGFISDKYLQVVSSRRFQPSRSLLDEISEQSP